MYTLQALWTQARERLDVTTVVLANRSYAILNMELHRVGAGDGGHAPAGCWTSRIPSSTSWRCPGGMGVPARRVETAEELTAALEASFAEPGPKLIEVPLP